MINNRVIDGKQIILNLQDNDTNNGIYKWSFISTSGVEIYIGQTARTFIKRTNEHIYDATHNRHKGSFQAAWNKATTIEITVVERLDNVEGADYEAIETKWITTYGLNNLVNNVKSKADWCRRYKARKTRA